MIGFLIGSAVAGYILNQWKGGDSEPLPREEVDCAPHRESPMMSIHSNPYYRPNETHITYNITINGKVDEHEHVILDRCFNGGLQRFESRNNPFITARQDERSGDRQGEKSGD